MALVRQDQVLEEASQWAQALLEAREVKARELLAPSVEVALDAALALVLKVLAALVLVISCLSPGVPGAPPD